MNPNDPNVVLLELVAEQLGECLRNEFVFVGGAVAGLLVTDPALPPIRPTEYVDLIVHAAVLADYHRVEEAMRDRGFVQDIAPTAPICRWRIGNVAVDVMPTLEKILGFSNCWYPLALQTARPVTLPSGTTIRLVPPPLFLATKLEAFSGRGNNDYLFSHDLGDLISVIDGRETLLDECATAPKELRTYLRERFATLLSSPAFIESLPCHLPGDAANQERAPELEDKLRRLAQLD